MVHAHQERFFYFPRYTLADSVNYGRDPHFLLCNRYIDLTISINKGSLQV